MISLPIHKNRNALILQRRIISRSDGTLSTGLSPIERWSDDNYVPQLLNYVWQETKQAHIIIARLRGHSAEDVHVDLRYGHVIILLSSSLTGGILKQPARSHSQSEIQSGARSRTQR